MSGSGDSTVWIGRGAELDVDIGDAVWPVLAALGVPPVPLSTLFTVFTPLLLLCAVVVGWAGEEGVLSPGVPEEGVPEEGVEEELGGEKGEGCPDDAEAPTCVDVACVA